MKIDRIEAFHVRLPLPRDFRGSSYSVPEKNAVVTRVFTDEGLIGEAINGEGSAAMHSAMLRILRDELIPLMLGRDPVAIEAQWHAMWPATHRGGRDKWSAVRAVACIDTALWDIAGKRAGLPLYQMWGGARKALPIVAIGGQYHDGWAPQRYGEEMHDYVAIGLAGCKFKVGGAPLAEDVERIGAARRAGGDGFLLFADANRGWDRRTAYDFAMRVRDLDLVWLEEPCHWDDDRRDLALLRGQTGVPIAAGQSEITVQDCRDLMLDAAIDICNLDASWGGGPSAWLRVAHMAAAFGVQMGHHGEPLLGAHLLAAVQNGTYLETHHPDRDPVFHRMAVDKGTIDSGAYVLGEAPGWGFVLDQEFMNAHVVDRVNSA